MTFFEFHVIGSDEVFRIHSREYIPGKGDTVFIDECKFRVDEIETRFKKDFQSSCPNIWLDHVIVYLEQYDQK